MGNDFEVSVEQEIAQITMERPHIVLLGAGASRAAFPNGERNGKRLPVMRDFADIVPVGGLLRRAGFSVISEDFEVTYATIAADPAKEALRLELEETIYGYFESLGLPLEATLYDLLLLSLRSKDVVATFNWDPFLIQAARRNHVLSGRLPRILFLHGNVLAGYCARDSVHGVKGARCSRCGQPFQPSRLLYPIAQKDYHVDPMIADAWDIMDWALKNAFMVTVFGYSAPVSDKSAIDLMSGAWGGWERRELEQVEIIDIREEDDLIDSWNAFIHTHHYQVHASFSDSWLAKHPRRSGEAYWNEYIDAKFIDDNPIPDMTSLPSLWEWFEPLLSVEEKHAQGDDTGDPL